MEWNSCAHQSETVMSAAVVSDRTGGSVASEMIVWCFVSIIDFFWEGCENIYKETKKRSSSKWAMFRAWHSLLVQASCLGARLRCRGVPCTRLLACWAVSCSRSRLAHSPCRLTACSVNCSRQRCATRVVRSRTPSVSSRKWRRTPCTSPPPRAPWSTPGARRSRRRPWRAPESRWYAPE